MFYPNEPFLFPEELLDPSEEYPKGTQPVFTTRRSLIATTVTVALTGIAALGTAAPASAAPADVTVRICHATGSASHPYVAQTMSAAKVLAGRFADNDIVPTFTAPNADGVEVNFWGHNTLSSTVSCDAVTPVTPTVSFIL